MATPSATDPTPKPNDPKIEGSDSDVPNSEDPKFENLNIDDAEPDDTKPEDVKSGAEEAQDSQASTLPAMPPPSITLASDQWQITIEKLLRLPGMVPEKQVRLFRPSNPIAEIAFALGVTDSAYTITESSWVPIAERVFDVQTCCMMNAKDIKFDIAADGWITWDISAEWYARVVQDLQGEDFHKDFRNATPAMVAFVARVYLQTQSWFRHHRKRGRQMHKQVMDSLRPHPSAGVVTRCSLMAKSFTTVVRLTRKRAIERVEEQNPHRDPPPHSDSGI